MINPKHLLQGSSSFNGYMLHWALRSYLNSFDKARFAFVPNSSQLFERYDRSKIDIVIWSKPLVFFSVVFRNSC